MSLFYRASQASTTEGRGRVEILPAIENDQSSIESENKKSQPERKPVGFFIMKM